MRQYKAGSSSFTKSNLVQIPVAIDVTGRGFASEPIVSYVSVESEPAVIGSGFTQNVDINFAATAIGTGFSSELTSTVLAANESFVTGGGFRSSASAVVIVDYEVNVTGTGFWTDPGIYGGSNVTGIGFSTAFESTVESSELITAYGRGFTQSVTITGVGNESANVTGRGWDSGLFYWDVTGRGWNTIPVISVITSTTFNKDQAFVLNVHTGEVSRYTNYPFSNIIHVNGKPYGVMDDGLYLLEGDDDVGTEINGTLITKETDFGIYQNKNVNYVYLNSDTETILTSFINGSEQNSYTSIFAGRKTKLGRGAKGRYWKFKLEKIKKIEGLEILPQSLQRRVR